MLPVRWMAPECLSDGRFTGASDLWSFAVCAWEIFSGGIIPYGTLTNSEIYTELMQGTRLGKPFYMPAPMYEICHDCWMVNADDRPDHDEVQNSLAAVRQDTIRHAAQQPVDFGLSALRSSTLVSSGSTSKILRTAVDEGACVVTAGTFGDEELYADDAAVAARLAASVSSVLSSEDGSDDADYEPIGQHQRDPKPAFYTTHRPSSKTTTGDNAGTWSQSISTDQNQDGYIPVGQGGRNVQAATAGLYVQNGATPIVRDLPVSSNADATLESGYVPIGQTGYRMDGLKANAELYAANGTRTPVKPVEEGAYLPVGQTGSPELYSPAAGQGGLPQEVALPKASRDGIVVNFVDNKPPPPPDISGRPLKSGGPNT